MVDETDPNADGIIDPNKVATRSSMLVTSIRFEVTIRALLFIHFFPDHMISILGNFNSVIFVF